MPAAQRSSPPPPPLLLVLFPSLLLILVPDGAVRAAEEGGGLPGDNGLGAAAAAAATSALPAEPQFALKVLMKDLVTRQPLPGASVDVYVNHTLRYSAQTGDTGEVLLWVAYSPGLTLTLLGNMEGYVPGPLPWKTTKKPVFSAVTLLLLPHSQGNIWLFEDSVLITGKIPDSMSQPRVKFPKNLLTISDKSNISSVKAYLTVPQHHLAKDCSNCTPAIISNKSVFRSVELKAIAAINVLLYSAGEELDVRGPIQISLPLDRSTRLRDSDTVPAWAFNFKTGAWENQGLGIVKAAGDELVWTYTASHLGYWIAASVPTSNGYMDHVGSVDFLSYHTYMLLGILAGTLAVAIGFLSILLCHCRGSYREPRRRRAHFSKLTVLKKDQTTSTHMEEGLLFHPGDHSLTSCSEPMSTPRHKANYNIYVDDPGSRPAGPLYENIAADRIKGPQPPPHYINNEEVNRLREKSEQNRVNINTDSFFQDKLVHIYNQPMAVIQASELFSAQEQQLPSCKSATFPRNGLEYDPHSEPNSKDSYTQTLPKVHHSQSGNSPQQSRQDEPQPLETPPQSQGPNSGVWGRYNNLLESSVSVPGTLNEAAGMQAFSTGHGVPRELQGISERTLLELTRGKSSSSHPRAWFVSLDGKPAAQVRHSIIDLQSRHRPPSSNDTSLDSGVDMNEPQQNIREAERDRPAIRASSFPHHSRSGRYGEEQDLSSSESGTTATCTPEDPSLRNILDGSSGAIPNIPEERDGMDTSSAQEDSESRGTPPPRRLRKVREKVKADKRSGKHMREGRHLAKQS